jgi:all-trans-retinol dehydrogenase (NAD+)
MCSLDSIKEGAETARAAFGDVTILINNAGVVTGKNTLDLTEAEIDRTMQVNCISHLHTIREFLPGMKSQKRGHIVTIASMVGLVAAPAVSDYCASKFGAVGLDETMRFELRNQGLHSFIKTTCIMPYIIDTGMFDGATTAFPFYRLQPDEVAKRVVDAIGQEEATVVIPWRGNVAYITHLFPIEMNDFTSNLLGANDAMDTFTGRKDKRMPGLTDIQN